jgi:hypothetical protein
MGGNLILCILFYLSTQAARPNAVVNEHWGVQDFSGMKFPVAFHSYRRFLFFFPFLAHCLFSSSVLVAHSGGIYTQHKQQFSDLYLKYNCIIAQDGTQLQSVSK